MRDYTTRRSEREQNKQASCKLYFKCSAGYPNKLRGAYLNKPNDEPQTVNILRSLY